MNGEIEPERIDGADGGMLLLCDHASNRVPDGIDLGIDPALLGLHIGYDIGAGEVTRALAARLGVPAILGTVSRLVIDLHREPDHPALIPLESDGHAIPGNAGADRLARIRAIHAPYHRAISRQLHAYRPQLLLAIHSFTPALEQDGVQRPWEAGVLYNRDMRAARPLLELLRMRGIKTGDNQPYSGRLLNMTLNRHGEANGIACVSLEIRNDAIDSPDGVAHWVDLLAEIVPELRNRVASKGVQAT